MNKETQAGKLAVTERRDQNTAFRAIGGWALLANALLLLLVVLGSAVSGGGAPLFLVASEVLGLLFLVGLPAIQALQPQTGRLGQAGLWCLGLAVGIALIVRMILLVSTVDVGDIVPFSSSLLALVGSLLVGWVTIQAKVFSPVFGWLLMVGGVLNFVSGLAPAGIGTTIVGIIAGLAQVGALAGYGWTIVRSTRERPQAG